uniref:Uncharacterized protein n=1 Tax=Romanomermis culicivorax TaxID=13658 RepID=A0A915L7P4_ROMCU
MVKTTTAVKKDPKNLFAILRTIDGAKYRLESVINDEKSIFGINYIKYKSFYSVKIDRQIEITLCCPCICDCGQKLKSTIIDDDQVFICQLSPTSVKVDMDGKIFLGRSKSMPLAEDTKKSYSWLKKPRNSVNSSSDKRSAITSIEEEEFEHHHQQQDQLKDQIYKLDFASVDGESILSGLASFEHHNSMISDFDIETPIINGKTQEFNYGDIKLEAKPRNSLSSSIDWIFGLKKQNSTNERKFSNEVFDKDQMIQTAWVHDWVDSQGNSQK